LCEIVCFILLDAPPAVASVTPTLILVAVIHEGMLLCTLPPSGVLLRKGGSMEIREAGEEDFQAIVEIRAEAALDWPERAGSVEAIRELDSRRKPTRLYGRWAAEVEGSVVGYCAFAQVDDYNKRKAFLFDVGVRADRRGRGIGTALFRVARDSLASRAEGLLCADGFTKYPDGMRFLEGLGFRETWRETPVVLEVESAHLDRNAEVEASLSREGIEIATMAELASDPGRDRKLYELYTVLSAFVPSDEGYVYEPPAFSDWMEEHVEDPEILPEACLVACKGERYIGLKEVGGSLDSATILCGLMGVLPEYRRKGIAYAMQARTIRYASAIGCPSLRSCTATVNKPMQRLYAELGYRKLYEWVQYMRELR